MMFKSMRVWLILWLAFCLSGCMSALTYTAPLKSKLVNGETTTGEFCRYEYSSSVSSDKLFFVKKPLCKESVMKMRHAQKELRCFSCALGEMVLYGLGMFDMLRAYAIIEDSKIIEPLAEFETGNMVACGPLEPAAEEMVVIDNLKLGLHRIASTDADGVLDLKKVLGDIHGAVNLKIHLASDNAKIFKYVYESGQQFSHYSGRK